MVLLGFVIGFQAAGCAFGGLASAKCRSGGSCT